VIRSSRPRARDAGRGAAERKEWSIVTLRIGMIGAGGIARQHLDALQGVDDVRVVAVTDPLLERAQALAGPLGAVASVDHREAIERADAVWVCTPPSTRRRVVVDAAEAGRHVMSEKPIAASREDGLAIVEAVERAGVRAIVDFNGRFRWPFRRVKELVDSGELGQIVSVWCHRIGGGTNPARNSWRHDPRFVTGFTVESLSHDIDHVRWIAGPINAAIGVVERSMPDLPTFDNTMSALLYLERGGSAQLHASWASSVAAGQRGVIGTKGAVVVEGQSIWDLTRLRWRSDDSGAEQIVELQGPIATDMGYRAMARHFVDCIRRDVAPTPSLRDGLAALEVSLAILRSSASRQVEAVEPRHVSTEPASPDHRV
jgi:predicted dehydrogenase